MSTKEEKVAQDKHQIQLFANLLLPEPCPDGSVAHLFGLPSKSCSWQKGAAGFSSAAAAMDEKGDDVYFGVALRRVGLGKVSRGNAEDCTHALGVGIDIDVGVDGHGGGKRRFRTVADALDCVSAAVPLPATAIVLFSALVTTTRAVSGMKSPPIWFGARSACTACTTPIATAPATSSAPPSPPTRRGRWRRHPTPRSIAGAPPRSSTPMASSCARCCRGRMRSGWSWSTRRRSAT